MHYESARTAALRNRFEKILLSAVPAVRINGDTCNRLPNNSSITFPRIAGNQILKLCNGPELSTGSACNCASGKLSHVLEAIGLASHEIRCTIRVGTGRFNSPADIDHAAALILRACGITPGAGTAPESYHHVAF